MSPCSFLCLCQRYLSSAVSLYASELCALFPSSLSVVYLCNSGSEANDLALRLARAYTRRSHVIVHDCAYHGHTAATVELSPYKWRHQAKGRLPQPPHVHALPTPDLHAWRRTHRSSRGSEGRGERVHEFTAAHDTVEEGEQVAAAVFYAAQLERCLQSPCNSRAPLTALHS